MKSKSILIIFVMVIMLAITLAPAGAATQLEIDQAITDGLAWQATQQNADGSFGSGPNRVAYTAAAVLAFENEGHFPGGGSAYSTHVEKGLDFIFGYAHTVSIGPQTAGNPDSDADGLGVSFYDESVNREVYETGMVMMTIAASNTPARVVTTGPLSGWTYYDVMVDMVDWAAFGQVESAWGRGGWRYYANYSSSDNSTAQWPVLGLIAAEQWGIFAPAWVKSELELWVTYIQDASGCSGYDYPTTYVNASKTGGLLVQFYYLGDDSSTPRVQKALDCLNTKWNDVPSGTWYGNKGHSYAMFSIYKGLELLGVGTIPNAPANTETPAGDWYGDYAEYLVTHQNADGSWNGYDYWNSWLSTGWYIVILQATILPVEVDVQVPDCACEDDGYTVTVDYSVERFPADGELRVYEDGVLYATEPLVAFQGSATKSYTIASDTPGTHNWKAEIDVAGGGITVMVEDTDSLNVCETPQVAGIPDDMTPFATFDLDDYLTYGGGLPVTWSVEGVPAGWTVVIDSDNVVTVTAPPEATDPEDITFTASVECCPEVVCSDSDTATFTPNRPPECSTAYPSVDMLWPPNHRFWDIEVLGVTDPDGDPVTITIDSIWQDELVDERGDGTFAPDGDGVGTSTAQVRAERSGRGDGRFYHITFTADDGKGGTCGGPDHVIKVIVAHDRRRRPPVDGGPLFDSTIVP